MDSICNNQSLGGVDINRGIFQADIRSPLLSVLYIVSLNVVLFKSEVYINFQVARKR